MKKIAFYLFLLTLFPRIGFSDTKVYFTPSDDCTNEIISLINSAKKSIYIALYSFTEDIYSIPLEKAYYKGLDVKIILDKSQALNKKAQAYRLYALGIPVKVNTSYRIEHNKFMIIDNEFVSTGSFNWTNNARLYNSENCLFLWNDPKTTDTYTKRFLELWDKYSQSKTDSWFKKNF